MTGDRIAFVVDAVTDLEELAEYIDARNPVAAIRVRDAIRAAIASLAESDPRLDTRTVTLRSGVVCQRHYVRSRAASARPARAETRGGRLP